MAQSSRPGDKVNSPSIIIVNNSTPPPPPPEKRGGPGPWAVFVASVAILALAVIVALLIVALTGDPARAQALGAFLGAIFAAP